MNKEERKAFRMERKKAEILHVLSQGDCPRICLPIRYGNGYKESREVLDKLIEDGIITFYRYQPTNRELRTGTVKHPRCKGQYVYTMYHLEVKHDEALLVQ